jgi:predicted transport protein
MSGSMKWRSNTLSDLKLFRVSNDTSEEMKGTSVALEKSLQTLIERHLETFLGIYFLISEHSTGKVHNGRIDTLGIDENNCPVIIEYKRALNENVINQGLFYLDWLMDHKAEFKLLVLDRFGKEQADNIDWSAPRLICIAGDFTNYDEHAVKQIPRNIDLIRYRRYGEEFLLLELAHTSSVQPVREPILGEQKAKRTEKANDIGGQTINTGANSASHLELLDRADDDLRDLFERLKAFLLALGNDVQMKSLKSYVAFTRMKTIAYVHIGPTRFKGMVVSVKIDPASIALQEGFTQVDSKGYVIITIKNTTDLERAQPLLTQSYEAN